MIEIVMIMIPSLVISGIKVMDMIKARGIVKDKSKNPVDPANEMDPEKVPKISSSGAGICVKCKLCGSVIQSKHVHDMQKCSCGAIAIDGGSHYTKLTGELDNIEWCCHGDA